MTDCSGLPPSRLIVESAFGSQPIWMTFFPRAASAAARLLVSVDFPMPPFPYTAIFRIVSLLKNNYLYYKGTGPFFQIDRQSRQSFPK